MAVIFLLATYQKKLMLDGNEKTIFEIDPENSPIVRKDI